MTAKAGSQSDSLSRGRRDQVVRSLQYEVREGREAGEVVVIPAAFIANRNSSFILQEVFNDGEEN